MSATGTYQSGNCLMLSLADSTVTTAGVGITGANALFGLIAVVFGLIILVAGAVVVAKGAYVREQLAGLRGDRDDLMRRVDILEAENTRIAAELQVEKEKVTVLTDAVTGKEQLDRIEKSIITLIDTLEKRALV